jgi:hypothetical protein
MVARLTPDQKVACSIHVGFKPPNKPDLFNFFPFCFVSLSFFFLFGHFCSTKLKHSTAQPTGPLSLPVSPSPAPKPKGNPQFLTTLPETSPFSILNPTLPLHPHERSSASEEQTILPDLEAYPPSSRGHGDRHAEDQGHRGRGND